MTRKKKIALVVGGAVVLVGVGTGVAKAATIGSSSAQVTLTTQTVTASDGGFPSSNTAEAFCPAGTVVTGGGYDAGGVAGTAIGQSYPDAAGNGWVGLQTGGASGQIMTVYAVCAALS